LHNTFCCILVAKMKKEEQNPFPVSGYHGSELFCDREEETRVLTSNALNGINTVLLSVRRMGKTGLLHHVLAHMNKKKIAIGIYIDIFDTESLHDFINRLTSAMIQAVPPRTHFSKLVMEFIKQLRPIISYDELTGQPQVTITYSQTKQYEHTLQSIFSFLESQGKDIVIAIDEFQQIAQYPEKNMEAILRTHIQNLKNIKFIFSGSSPHLLAQMFHNTKRPFFSSASTLALQEIEVQEYKKFIINIFNSRKRKISDEAIDFILMFSKCHTFYTQALCNKLFADGERNITIENVQKAAYDLMKQNEAVYFQYRTMLTTNQWDMLKATAKETVLYQPTSKAIVKKYGLGSSSVVQRSMEALLEKEMIYIKETKVGVGYCVYDCFLSRWLERY